MSDTSDTPTGDDELEVIEVVTGGVDDDGDLVVDDLLAVVDGEGNVLATDETLTVQTVEGPIVVDETISVIGDDGELHAVEEDITVIDVDDEG